VTVTFRQQGAMGVLTATGSLTASTADRFREEAFGHCAAHADLLCHVLDLSAVDFLDSSGLGALVALLKRVEKQGGQLRLAGLQKRVRIVLEITRAARVFDSFASVDEALAKLLD